MYHSKNEIHHFLQRAFFAVITTQSENDILSSSLMTFAHSKDGILYLATKKNRVFFNAIEENTMVSVLVFKEEEDLEEIREVSIYGSAVFVDNDDDETLDTAYKLLGTKSPVLGNLRIDLDERKKYTIIKVIPERITYSSIKEINEGENPTIIKRVSK